MLRANPGFLPAHVWQDHPALPSAALRAYVHLRPGAVGAIGCSKPRKALAYACWITLPGTAAIQESGQERPYAACG